MNSKELKVEIVSVHDSAMPLCANAAILVKALIADPAFTLKGGRLTHAGTFNCEYSSIDWFKIEDKLGILHSFRFVSEGDIDQNNCDAFSSMLRAFRTNLRTLEAARIETLWDDVSFRYCRLAYPVILNTENLMRRLITQFMLKTLGAKWIEVSAPKEVREQLGKAKRGSDDADPLHDVDFDTLIDYLTKPYASDTAESMHKYIRGLNPASLDAAKANIDQLKAMIPQSNWSRYFSQIVECEDTLLRSKWGELYLLRCKVAHNTYLSAQEFERVLKLANDLDLIISSAIAKLEQVKISVKAAAELQTMATQLSEDVSNVTPTELIYASYAGDDTRRDGVRFRRRLHLEINRTRDVLRAVAVELGEPLPLENTLIDLQRILLRCGAINLEESNIIDRATEIIYSRNLEYPPAAYKETLAALYTLSATKAGQFLPSRAIRREAPGVSAAQIRANGGEPS
ncbi:HEPN domain-containing protein [Paraburkholderia sp. FT54]|uniref:HEPN domain-containing protein n=1 Tax=Paraburkholderia sp. FT54 TaxID=3074437 RepID=UPI002877DE73|nr:HEPN domain-containing protein [Paraburkholderia sp. FT54]WNC88877.1 HEPN domain-containing protein [Paraburkholderia sp. FT54]